MLHKVITLVNFYDFISELIIVKFNVILIFLNGSK